MEISPEQYRMLDRLTKIAANRFHRIGPAREELIQEAWRIGLSTLQADVTDDAGYTFVAIRRELGNYVSKSISHLTIKDSWERAREFRHACPIEDTSDWLAGDAPTPEQALLEAERKEVAQAWRIRVWRALLGALQVVPPEARDEVEAHTLEPLHSGDAAARAARLGMTTRQYYKLQSTFMSALRSNPTLWGLHKEHAEIGPTEDLDL